MNFVSGILFVLFLVGPFVFGIIAYPFSAFLFARKTGRYIWLWFLVGLKKKALPEVTLPMPLPAEPK